MISNLYIFTINKVIFLTINKLCVLNRTKNLIEKFRKYFVLKRMVKNEAYYNKDFIFNKLQKLLENNFY